MELIFGSEKDLIEEYRLSINEILPKLNECNFCDKLKCRYYKIYSVNCNVCREVRCFNCTRFNKPKDILINSNNNIISDYVKNILYDFFPISDFSISFYDLNITLNSSKNISNIQVFNQSIKSNDI